VERDSAAGAGSTLLIRNAGLEAEGMRGFVRARFEGEGIGADRLDLEGPAEHDEFLGSYGESTWRSIRSPTTAARPRWKRCGRECR